jgi:PAS domain S-box-containing protein
MQLLGIISRSVDFWLWIGGAAVILVAALALGLRQRMARATAAIRHRLNPATTWRRLLMEMSSDAMVLVDRAGRILEVNQNACDLCGWTQQDLLGKSVATIVGQQDREAATGALLRLPGARTLTGHLLVEKRNRELVRTEWRWVPAVKDQFYALIRDLRAPTHFETPASPGTELEAIHRVSVAVSQLFDLQTVLDHAIEECMKVVNCDMGVISLIDPASGRLTVAAQRGLPEDKIRRAMESVSLEGNPLSQQLFQTRSILYHKSLNRAPLLPSVLELLQEEQIQSLISIPVVSKGRVLGQLDLGVRRPNTFTAVNTTVLSAIGEQIGMAIQNARLVQEVGEKAVHLQHVLDSSPAGILVITYLPQAEKVTLVNRHFGEIFGQTAEGLLGRSLAELRRLLRDCFDDPQVFERHFAQLVTDRETEDRGELELQRPKAMTLDHFTGPVFDDFKQIIGRIWVLQDVTEQKAIADSLRQTQKLESVGALASGIAHDFRNLLATVLGNLLLMREQLGEDHPVARLLINAESAANSAAEVCKGLLAFGRRAPTKLVPVRLAGVIEQSVRLLKGSMPPRIQLLTDVAPDLRPVAADATQLLQVIMNLAINACDAMPHGGRLVLRAVNRDVDKADCVANAEARPGSFVVLEIEDTGEGIPPSVMARIFEPFFTTKPTGKGTGLGLSIVYGIIKAHNGWIQVRSQVAVGTSFQIYIPATDQPSPEAAPSAIVTPSLPSKPIPTPLPMNAPQPSSPAPTTGQAVLIADDDPMVLELIQTFIQKAGFEVLAADGGQRAVDLLAANRDRVALAILDLHMPIMGGEDCLRELKQIKPSLKAFFLTGYDAETAKEAVERAGAVGSLCKPIQRAELDERVREAIATAPPP